MSRWLVSEVAKFHTIEKLILKAWDFCLIEPVIICSYELLSICRGRQVKGDLKEHFVHAELYSGGLSQNIIVFSGAR